MTVQKGQRPEKPCGRDQSNYVLAPFWTCTTLEEPACNSEYINYSFVSQPSAPEQKLV